VPKRFTWWSCSSTHSSVSEKNINGCGANFGARSSQFSLSCSALPNEPRCSSTSQHVQSRRCVDKPLWEENISDILDLRETRGMGSLGCSETFSAMYQDPELAEIFEVIRVLTSGRRRFAPAPACSPCLFVTFCTVLREGRFEMFRLRNVVKLE
jgi:hypothetical protein